MRPSRADGAAKAGAAVLAALFLLGSAQRAAAETFDDVSRAFLARPQQQADMQAALKAKAARLPGLCPEVTFSPAALFVKPVPRFDASGTLVDGSIRQSFSSAGCGAFKPTFNIWVIATPRGPLRTISAMPGSSRTFVDLQERAVATLADAARGAIPDCPGLTVVDTKLRGFDTPADDPAGAFREDWLVGGCGKFAIVPLHFVPDRPNQNTTVTVSGPVKPAELR